MATFAQPSDLIVNAYDPAAVTGALEWATSFIAGYCDQVFSLVTGDVVTLNPQGGSALLPECPVVQVSLVEGWLPNLSGAGMAWTPLTNYQYTSAGLIYDTTGLPGVSWGLGPSWPWLPGSLRVTYDHGYAAIPQPIVSVCARLATQYLENPGQMMQRRVGDEEARFNGSAGVSLNAMDRAILDRYVDVGVS